MTCAITAYAPFRLPRPVLRERVGVRVLCDFGVKNPHPSPLPEYRARGPEPTKAGPGVDAGCYDHVTDKPATVGYASDSSCEVVIQFLLGKDTPNENPSHFAGSHCLG